MEPKYAEMTADEMEVAVSITEDYSGNIGRVVDLYQEGHSFDNIERAYELRDTFPTTYGKAQGNGQGQIRYVGNTQRLAPSLGTIVGLLEIFPEGVDEEDLTAINGIMYGTSRSRSFKTTLTSLDHKWGVFLEDCEEGNYDSFQDAADEFFAQDLEE
jgi:hypothetical protein